MKFNESKTESGLKLSKELHDNKIKVDNEKNSIIKTYKADIKSWWKDLGNVTMQKIQIEQQLEIQTQNVDSLHPLSLTFNNFLDIPSMILHCAFHPSPGTKIYYCRLVRLGLWEIFHYKPCWNVIPTRILVTLAVKAFQCSHNIGGNNLHN